LHLSKVLQKHHRNCYTITYELINDDNDDNDDDDDDDSHRRAIWNLGLLYTVLHKIGTPLFSSYNFSK